MFYTMIFCSYLNLIKWLQNNLLTCPFKKLTGIDCPGCGLQRSLIAFVKGDFYESLTLYPATFPLIFLAAFNILNTYYRLDKGLIKNNLHLFTGLIIAGSYLIKLSKYC